MLKLYKLRFLVAFLAFSLLTGSELLAQQLPQINYQGVARKADGSPVSEQPITLRLTIRDGGASGSAVYSETRERSTNKFGLFTVVIGSSGALSQSGTMVAVDWSTGNKFLQVEIDPLGGSRFVNMGTSQLQSVPYAIYASSATPGGKAGGDLNGTYPNPTVSKLQGADVSNAIPTPGQVLKWNGKAWIPSDEEGAVGTLTANSPIGAATVGRNTTISMVEANATTDGYLSKNDWLVFNGKASITYVDAAISGNSDAMAAELTRATIIEIARATAVETVLKNATEVNAAAITAEVKRATDAEGVLKTATETNAAAITANGTAAIAEVIRATAAEATLTTATQTNTTDITALSTATQTALDAKASTTDLALKAPLASPAFTGTVTGVTQGMVGLGNVDNTTDLLKPISTATQTALDSKASTTDLALKAPLASPTFSGTVTAPSFAGALTGNATTATTAGTVSAAAQTAITSVGTLTSLTSSGAITAASFIKSGGTASQISAADGSVLTAGTNISISNGTISATASPVREIADEFNVPTAAQTQFILTQIPSVNSKVKMYVNGIRISNTAYSISGTILTYFPANNGSYELSVNDRIQFDYFY